MYSHRYGWLPWRSAGLLTVPFGSPKFFEMSSWLTTATIGWKFRYIALGRAQQEVPRKIWGFRLLVRLTLFLVHRFLSPWWLRPYVTPKRRFLQEPHGVTSQKTPFYRRYHFQHLFYRFVCTFLAMETCLSAIAWQQTSLFDILAFGRRVIACKKYE
jgi:hypothetical protein